MQELLLPLPEVGVGAEGTGPEGRKHPTHTPLNGELPLVVG